MSNDKGIHTEEEPGSNDTVPTIAEAHGGDKVAAESPAPIAHQRSQAGGEGHELIGDPSGVCPILGLTRTDLVNMSVRQLNFRMRTAGLNGQQTRAIKHLRRMLKNRGYAAICRTRRVVQRGHLEEQKEMLRADIEALEVDNCELATEVARIECNYTGLLAWCIEHRMLTAEEIQSFTDSPQDSK